jgi:hypothetical protein
LAAAVARFASAVGSWTQQQQHQGFVSWVSPVAFDVSTLSVPGRGVQPASKEDFFAARQSSIPSVKELKPRISPPQCDVFHDGDADQSDFFMAKKWVDLH